MIKAGFFVVHIGIPADHWTRVCDRNDAAVASAGKPFRYFQNS